MYKVQLIFINLYDLKMTKQCYCAQSIRNHSVQHKKTLCWVAPPNAVSIFE